ncbi:MAG: hypothetical protein QM770_04215 [Tepidisphaeraceae bacterium]
MTDDMAASITRDPDVQAAIAREGKLRVVVLPVENRLTGEVLPRGRAEIFVARLRVLLANQRRDAFQWILNRDTFYNERNRELDAIDLGPSPDAINPNYALTAIFESLADENGSGRSAYYLCVYELRDLRDRTLLWTDKYEVKKLAVKGWLDD